MDYSLITFFLVVVLFGSYFQSVTGFAMGMIIVSLLGGLRVVDIPVLTAVISLLTIVNVILALKGRLHEVDRRLFLWLGLGQVPAIFVGLSLMNWLDLNSRWVLEVCLGVFISLGSLSMVLKPEPNKDRSNRLTTWVFGTLGGFVGGMFSASGPVLGWFGYRQPLPMAVIRSTLLACFILTTSTRTILVGAGGDLTREVLTLVLLGLPMVVYGTWLGRRFPPNLSETKIKRLAFGLMLLIGLWITVSSISTGILG